MNGLRGPARVVRAAVDDLLTTIFPAKCRTCALPLLRASFYPVCDECVSRVRPQRGSMCGCCGEALGMESERFAGQFGTALFCSPCRLVAPEFERAVAFGLYENELREMVHLLKYERVAALGRPLGKMLARAVETLRAEVDGELLVVAVPLFSTKKRQRGYNQAEVLAAAAVRELRRNGWKLRAAHQVLERTRDTESQYALTPRARRQNLRGAFTVKHGEMIKNRGVLLVDDIYTTGATARECARVLKRAGAAKVWVATAARAQEQVVAQWDGGLRESERFGGDTVAWDYRGTGLDSKCGGPSPSTSSGSG